MPVTIKNAPTKKEEPKQDKESDALPYANLSKVPNSTEKCRAKFSVDLNHNGIKKGEECVVLLSFAHSFHKYLLPE